MTLHQAYDLDQTKLIMLPCDDSQSLRACHTYAHHMPTYSSCSSKVGLLMEDCHRSSFCVPMHNADLNYKILFLVVELI